MKNTYSYIYSIFLLYYTSFFFFSFSQNGYL